MDGARFDHIVKVVARSADRRTALRAAVAGGLAAMWRGAPEATAGGATCKQLRQTCRRASQCCAGRCRKGKCACPVGTTKGGTNTCLVTGACPDAANSCGTAFDCGTNASGGSCLCFPDAAGSGFCGTNITVGSCNGCTSNGDCVTAHGQGFACVVVGLRDCPCPAGERICMGPCPNPRTS